MSLFLKDTHFRTACISSWTNQSELIAEYSHYKISLNSWWSVTMLTLGSSSRFLSSACPRYLTTFLDCLLQVHHNAQFVLIRFIT